MQEVPDHTIIDIRTIAEYDDHKIVSFLFDEQTGLSGIIAIHRSNKNIPSFGATRLWNYHSQTEGIVDALRLSRLMSYKSALAGLPCGGAKAVIFDRPELDSDPILRQKMFTAYAKRVCLFQDSFVTGTDVGVFQKDIESVRNVCSQIIGFNNNATKFTGLGIFESLKSALAEVYNSPEVGGKKIAIQGLGKVGGALLEHVAPLIGDGKIYVSDIDTKKLADIQKQYPLVEVVPPAVIHTLEVDIFSPCALGAVINHETVSEIKAKIIVGGANNQLSDESVGDTLFANGIVYAPDYVVNSGGIIAIYDEYEQPNAYDEKLVHEKVMHIPKTLSNIFAESKKSHRAPHRVANDMAEQIFNAYE